LIVVIAVSVMVQEPAAGVGDAEPRPGCEFGMDLASLQCGCPPEAIEAVRIHDKPEDKSRYQAWRGILCDVANFASR